MDINKLKNIIANQLDVDVSTITNETRFVDDLGADSLDTVELVMAIEDEFDIEIEDEAAEKIQTLDDIIKFLESKGV